MSDTVLVVIDMQKQFEGAKGVRTRVIRAIKDAQAKGWPIYNLVYRSGPCYFRKDGEDVLPSVQRALDAGSYVQVDKHYDDGGKELHQALKKAKVRADTFIFCGVNATACVADTVHSFAKLRKNVQCILSEGVGDYPNSNGQHHVAARMIALPNVVAQDIWAVYLNQEVTYG